MSFKNLMTGDDSCGGANPMSQMLKQFGQDRSLQRVKYIYIMQKQYNLQSNRIDLLDLLSLLQDHPQ